jgi:hypothetical protein
MTTNENTAAEMTASGPARPRTFQDDLLQDLRQTAPMPDPRPGAQRPQAKRPPVEATTSTPAVELRVTRNRWRSPSMRLASKGLVVSAGPISVSVGLSGR